jgi:hypothetical protein
MEHHKIRAARALIALREALLAVQRETVLEGASTVSEAHDIPAFVAALRVRRAELTALEDMISRRLA